MQKNPTYKYQCFRPRNIIGPGGDGSDTVLVGASDGVVVGNDNLDNADANDIDVNVIDRVSGSDDCESGDVATTADDDGAAVVDDRADADNAVVDSGVKSCSGVPVCG